MRVLVDGGNSGSGGLVRYLRGILSAGIPADVEVLVVASPDFAVAIGAVGPRVQVRPVAALGAPRRSTRLSWWRREWPALVASYAPDVVLHPSGFVRGRSGGVPVVTIHHNISPFTAATYRRYGWSRQSARLLSWALRQRRSFRRADGVVFHADLTRAQVGRVVPGMGRTAIVHNAVPSAFVGLPPRPSAALSTPVRLLCVSTLFLSKYQPNVVDAVADLRAETGLDLRLCLVGGGEPRARARLHRRIDARSAGTWAEVVEDVALDAMPAVYAAADVFVFPSAEETWPITLLEAMASGLPIACSDRLAMPQMLRDAGRYFDPEDTAAIAAALRELLADEELRSVLGKRAQEYAAEYTWERTTTDLYDFLRELTQEPTPR